MKKQEGLENVVRDLWEKGDSLRAAKGLMKEANVRFLMTREELPWKRTREGGPYGIEGHYPRAFFTPEARRVRDKREVLRAILRREGCPGMFARVERYLSPPYEGEGGELIAGSPARAARVAGEHVCDITVKGTIDGPGWFVLMDSYYPGWKAWVDGVPAKVERANYMFRAVSLSGGEHVIRFVYHPTSFLAGLFVTLCSCMGVGVFGGYVVFRRRRERELL